MQSSRREPAAERHGLLRDGDGDGDGDGADHDYEDVATLLTGTLASWLLGRLISLTCGEPGQAVPQPDGKAPAPPPCSTSSSSRGSAQLDYPGIVFRGPAHDRRAALAAGPDVWEVIVRLQELDGSEEERVSLLSKESDFHPRLIRIALDYAAEHADDIRRRIERNKAMAAQSQAAALEREALLA